MSKRILLMGAGGVVGLAMAEVLRESNEVFYHNGRSRPTAAPVLENITRLSFDANSSEEVSDVLSRLEPDIIFNFIAINDNSDIPDSPGDVLRSSFIPTLNILDGVVRNKLSSMVIISSSNELNSTSVDKKFNRTPYQLGKQIQEELVELFFRIYGVRGYCFRTPSVYGPGERNMRRLVPSRVMNLMLGKVIYSSGHRMQSYRAIGAQNLAEIIVGQVQEDLVFSGSTYSILPLWKGTVDQMLEQIDEAYLLLENRSQQGVQAILKSAGDGSGKLDRSIIEAVDWILKWNKISS